MVEVTNHVAMPFLQGRGGKPIAGPAEECRSATAAIKRADSMSRCVRVIGAIAFSRMGEREVEDATVLKKFGDVPDDLSSI